MKLITKNIINKDIYIYSNEYTNQLTILLNRFDNEMIRLSLLDNTYLFNKLVNLCTKKGKKKIAYLQVLSAFNLIKEWFMVSPSLLLKKAVLQIQTFIYLHQIPRGKKIRYFPRILPIKTRIHNALYKIVKQAFNEKKMYTNFHEALAHIIIKNSMFDDKYRNETKEITKKASENKRSIKNVKKKKVLK